MAAWDDPTREFQRLRIENAGLRAEVKTAGPRALREAARALRQYALLEFNANGPHDARGAALWDAASHLHDRADEMGAAS